MSTAAERIVSDHALVYQDKMVVIFSDSQRRTNVLSGGFKELGIRSENIFGFPLLADEEQSVKSHVSKRGISSGDAGFTRAVATDKMVDSLFELRRELFIHADYRSIFQDAYARGVGYVLFVGGDTSAGINQGDGYWKKEEKPKADQDPVEIALQQSGKVVQIDASLAMLAVPIEKIIPSLITPGGKHEKETFQMIANRWTNIHKLLVDHSELNIGVDISLQRYPGTVRTVTILKLREFDREAVEMHYKIMNLDGKHIAGGIDLSSFGYLDHSMMVHTSVFDPITDRPKDFFIPPEVYERDSAANLTSVFSADPIALFPLVHGALHQMSHGTIFTRGEILDFRESSFVPFSSLVLRGHHPFDRSTTKLLRLDT